MTQPSQREMLLVAFMQASNCSNYTGSWRHPETIPAQNILDLPLLPGDCQDAGDRPGFTWRSSMTALPCPAGTVTPIPRPWNMECGWSSWTWCPLLPQWVWPRPTWAWGPPTQQPITLPFTWRALFASLDHFTGGRAAWNVVTSLNDSEAHNFGVSVHLEHDDRYDVADEFMEAAIALWDSWEEGAVIADRG